VRSLSAIVVISVVLPSSVGLVPSVASPEQRGPYIFYGYAPPTSRSAFTETIIGKEAQRYRDHWINASTWHPPRLDVIGLNDSTVVEVWDLVEGRLIESFTVGRMVLHSLTLENGTYFKVVSDKPIVALLSGGGLVLGGGMGLFASFYPSTDGGLSGREFIFLAGPTMWVPPLNLSDYHIFGVENAHIRVYAGDALVQELDVAANAFKKFSAPSGRVYRVTSSGRILVAGLALETFKYLPSLAGGFVGRHFMGMLPYAGSGAKESLMVVAVQDSDVGIYDLTKPGWSIALSGPDVRRSLRAGEQWFIHLDAQKPIRVEGTGDITVLIATGGPRWGTPPADNVTTPENIGDDVSLIGARPGETLSFYAPTEAVIFAAGDGVGEIDGVPVSLERDRFYTAGSGVHTVSAEVPVIVEVLGWADTWEAWGGRLAHGYDNWGSYLLSVQGLAVSYPEPPPLGGLGELLPFIALGVAVPIAAAATALFIRRRRRTR